MISTLLHWYAEEKRSLPWRETHDPYKIWVSEIFLQQTQAGRVIDFYTQFLEKFPTVQCLSKSSWDEFLPYFQGLGFYSRGRNMLKTAKIITESFSGVFPNDAKQLQTLPGIGAYTAAAIQSFGYGESVPALDVNLFRVLGRVWDLENQKEITKRAKEWYAKTPHGDLLNHAFMDLGSSLCLSKRTQCADCPIKNYCAFFQAKKTVEVNTSPKAPVQRCEEIAVMVLRNEGKVLLEHTNNAWNFPSFQNKAKQDHRHFLQEKAKEVWDITISVRPPFFTMVQHGKRYRFSRCQILQGDIPIGKWKRAEETKDFAFTSEYSEGFLEKWKKMRT